MPRRAARLTLPKKKPTNKKPKLAGGDPAAPTDEEWERMVEYGSFIVRDEEGDEHTFKRGDVAMVLPHGVSPGDPIEPYDYWVAKIREVRLRTQQDVWTKIQWYWSGQEVHGAVKSFDDKACGRYERIFSDHFDYVSTSAFDAVTPMKKLNDSDIEQPHIPRGVFYTRYTFEYRARNIQPKPGLTTCLCLRPYAPDDPAPLSLMHFCPRPACRRWFHARCLLRAGLGSEDPDPARRRRLLLASPDVEGVVEGLGEGGGEEEAEGVNRRCGWREGTGMGARGGGGVTVEVQGGLDAVVVVGVGVGVGTRGRRSFEDEDPEEDEEEAVEPDSDADAESDDMRLAALPRHLVHIAEQPIVRGAAFPAGGVAGNVAAVVRARRMVYAALRGEEVPAGWEEELGVGVEEAVVEVEVPSDEEEEEDGEGDGEEGKARGKAREKVKGKAKGRMKAKKRERTESVRALLCPDCGGAI
ncbi:hypothetical protein LshimejAT787_0704480 [Lyophyllum shimeji]|uniref:BAH domain-containing protein n=1 Tax=Lyophyllum shimeji TaxID=47721 RepID=A0A9P3UNR2_LYOSH|nr:hypothetical protein LshimejAT787_0704480 [Lyophyllum shimeji]